MMFEVQDEEAAVKTLPVRPNDIINIETPQFENILPVQGKKFVTFQKVKKISTFPKTNTIERNISTLGPHQIKRQQGNSMSRGDPFLPSVISDESPLVDCPVKSYSRKKPTDCKCKGSGYNLSPSALLPEEMRQQWGVGDFGKPSAPSAQSITYSLTLCRGDGETPNVKLINLERNDQKHFQIPISTSSSILSSFVSNRGSSDLGRCQVCLQSSCTCKDPQHQRFRIPMKNDGRKVKSSLRTLVGKNKDSMSASTSGIKKISCYDCKENNNIISSSNFKQSNSSSSLPIERNYMQASSYDDGYYKAGLSCNQRSNKIKPSQTYDPGEFTDMTKDTLTPKVRYPHSKRPKRVLSEMTIPSMVSSDPNLNSNVPVYERSRLLPGTSAQSQMFLPQSDRPPQYCSCESCRPIRTFISQGDSLNYSHNNTPGIGHSAPVQTTAPMQNYKSPSMSLQHKRYHPYVTKSYAYPENSRPVYQSSDSFPNNSPEFDFDSLQYQHPQESSTALSIPNDSSLSAFDSYSDNDAFSTPANSPGGRKDILDLSVKETVDFFVSMKAPIICSESETLKHPNSPSSYNSPVYANEEMSSPYMQFNQPFFKSLNQTVHSREVTDPNQQLPLPQYPMHLQPQLPRYSNGRQQPSYPMSRTKPLPAQSMSLLYSSLVSDLEDELRSAVENIPMD